MESSNALIVDNPGTKKRRMHRIVVSRLPALFPRLMLLDYQIGLDLASGVGSRNVGNMHSEPTLASHSTHFDSSRTRNTIHKVEALCRIRRTYIHIRHSGRAWQPSPTRRSFCLVGANLCVRADTAVRPCAEELDRIDRRWTAHPFWVGEGCNALPRQRLSIRIIEGTNG